MSTETQRAEFSSIETIEYWRDAYSKRESGPHFWGHGAVVELLSEYLELRKSQAVEIEALKADIATYVRAASEQATEIERLNELLSFVERWANHHGRKPSVSAADALSVIQHHPDIKEITKSYADGVVPTTRDPYTEIEALRRLLCAVYAGFSSYTDDGEASDASRFPFIDFLRDSVDQIEAKMRERAFARVAAMQTKEAS